MKRRILIVDDSSTARAFAARALAAAGFEVETAADIFIAPVVTSFRPDLILMDMHVGQQKGDVAVRAMKKRAFAREVRMALYSSLPPDQLEALAREAGADGVVPKSDDPGQLVRDVERLLADGPPDADRPAAMLDSERER